MLIRYFPKRPRLASIGDGLLNCENAAGIIPNEPCYDAFPCSFLNDEQLNSDVAGMMHLLSHLQEPCSRQKQIGRLTLEPYSDPAKVT